MPTFRLPRRSAVDLVFDGELLADESSDEDGKLRYQQVRIYRTDTGRWVVQRLGVSRKPGEVDISDVFVCSTPAEVRSALTDKDAQIPDRVYLTALSYDALAAAVERDPALSEAIIERV